MLKPQKNSLERLMKKTVKREKMLLRLEEDILNNKHQKKRKFLKRKRKLLKPGSRES
jgi:hypothetical protein